MNNFMNELTFVVFTYNEESRIERVIKNLKPFGHVLVADNYSTDKTIEIAKKYGCQVFLNKNPNPGWNENEITTEKILNTVKTPWVYWAYADEMISQDTSMKIKHVIDNDLADIISIVKKDYYYGQFCNNSLSSRANRIFKKDAIDFSGNRMHEYGKPTVAKERIYQMPSNFFIHHFISHTASAVQRLHDSYTDVHAKQSKYRPPYYLILQSLKCFFVNYFLRKGFLAGSAGFYHVANRVHYNWLLSMKKHEDLNKLDRENIERINNYSREKILSCQKDKIEM
ncbi:MULTISPECIES: glycosyltransferase [unclassified Photorhabdus]|uniref:glycosyltransferase n=1 Tax=unclassified Photorhabdus TaxID=2620880 RepID=UPI000DCDFD8D|nr:MULTISPECIES: glycosyltransferase [unclassified Photorhabdus]RAW98440.1 hypothetical protein CKY05_11560 [Photorhabdus sp. S10-54]RAW98554.1 hypothetical protein CKY03_11085 [Photorhabdus sp. S9-53]RAX02755.1 hypothetical protein CKY04_11645 [Photorhabdus sp. S8-52]